MKVVVEFRSKAVATKFREYFKSSPTVTQNNNSLTFSKFDEAAFDLAANLEGLAFEDYIRTTCPDESYTYFSIPVKRGSSGSEYTREFLASRQGENVCASKRRKKWNEL